MNNTHKVNNLINVPGLMGELVAAVQITVVLLLEVLVLLEEALGHPIQ